MVINSGFEGVPDFATFIGNSNLSGSQKTVLERWTASKKPDDYGEPFLYEYATIFETMSQREFDIFSAIIEKEPEYKKVLESYWKEKIFWDRAYLPDAYSRGETRDLLEHLEKDGIRAMATDKYRLDWIANQTGPADPYYLHDIDPLIDLFFELYEASGNGQREDDGGYSFTLEDKDGEKEKYWISPDADYISVPDSWGDRRAHPDERKEIYCHLKEAASEQGVPVPNEMTKIQYYRNTQQMSRAELARKAGVSDMTVHRIEKGDRYGGTTLNVMNRLAEALGLALDEIIDYDRLESALTDEPDGMEG